MFGEIVDPRIRGDRLDEGVELLCTFWSGEEVDHRGAHFTADRVTVLPRPFQLPRIPLWFAARGGSAKPVRRAARYDGLYPIEVDDDQLADMLEIVRVERGSLDGFDVMTRPADAAQYRRFEEMGVTWAITGPSPGDDGVLDLASTPPAEVFGRGT